MSQRGVPAHLRWPFPVSSPAGPGARSRPDTARCSHTWEARERRSARGVGVIQRGKLQTSKRSRGTQCLQQWAGGRSGPPAAEERWGSGNTGKDTGKSFLIDGRGGFQLVLTPAAPARAPLLPVPWKPLAALPQCCFLWPRLVFAAGADVVPIISIAFLSLISIFITWAIRAETARAATHWGKNAGGKKSPKCPPHGSPVPEGASACGRSGPAARRP